MNPHAPTAASIGLGARSAEEQVVAWARIEARMRAARSTTCWEATGRAWCCAAPGLLSPAALLRGLDVLPCARWSVAAVRWVVPECLPKSCAEAPRPGGLPLGTPSATRDGDKARAMPACTKDFNSTADCAVVWTPNHLAIPPVAFSGACACTNAARIRVARSPTCLEETFGDACSGCSAAPSAGGGATCAPDADRPRWRLCALVSSAPHSPTSVAQMRSCWSLSKCSRIDVVHSSAWRTM